MIELYQVSDCGGFLIQTTDDMNHKYLQHITYDEARQLHQLLSEDFISPDHYYNPDDSIDLDSGDIIPPDIDPDDAIWQ